jgi:membrane-associated phospholipid phosphatase
MRATLGRSGVVRRLLFSVVIAAAWIALGAGAGALGPNPSARTSRESGATTAKPTDARPTDRWSLYTGYACRVLGTAAWPVLKPLSLGHYAATMWSENPRQCDTMLVHTIMGIGALAVSEIGHPKRPPAFGAGSFDRFFRNALRSRSKVDNVFNGTGGALLAPAIASGLLLLGSASIGAGPYQASVTRALPLLWVGIFGDTLPTEIAKRSTGRERPFLEFNNTAAIQANGINDEARESFYSGHASTAFFSAAFIDPVLADTIRSAHPDYCLWCGSSWGARLLRLGQATTLYGLATAVGYSRIQIDQHFMTDVLAGAFLGGAHGWLTYRWGYRASTNQQSVTVSGMQAAHGIALTWSF